jgi:integrase
MTMEDDRSTLPTPKRTPWNKGKLIGAKPPLLARHVWSIRTKLQIERRTRDLAMFNLAIDSKLRGCDVIALRVEDIAPNGYALARATVRQRKTGRPVRFELTEQTRQAVDDYLKVTGKVAGGFLFTSRRRPSVLSQTFESYIDANMILSRHDEEAGGIRSPCKGSHWAGRDIEGWECPSEDRQTRQDYTHDG